MQTARRLCLAVLVIVTALNLSRRPLPAEMPAPSTLPATLLAHGCGNHSPLRAQLRATATPLVGRVLPVEVSVLNQGLEGPFACALSAPPGAIAGVDLLEQVHELPRHGHASWTTRVRVLTPEPFDLRLVVRSLSPKVPAGLTAESGVPLYPFRFKDGSLTVSWNPETFRARSVVPERVITLPNGDQAVLRMVQ